MDMKALVTFSHDKTVVRRGEVFDEPNERRAREYETRGIAVSLAMILGQVPAPATAIAKKAAPAPVTQQAPARRTQQRTAPANKAHPSVAAGEAPVSSALPAARASRKTTATKSPRGRRKAKTDE